MLWLMSAALGGTIWLTPATSLTNGMPRPDALRGIDVLLTTSDRHVRATHPSLEPVIAEGVRRSATFARLVAALNATDVIVYVEPGRDLPNTVDGRIQLVPILHYQRYLRVQVRTGLPRDALISVIAHELWHALEIATAPEVRDAATLAKLYGRIGSSVAGAKAFETAAAQRTGRQVRWELQA